MSTLNTHLNLFQHYAASDDQQVLENNLTRALALCLQHDPLFLYALLGAIVGEAELRQHLHLTDAADRLVINVQQAAHYLTSCATLYPVALTAAELPAASYATVAPWRNESSIPDLTIRYKDVLVLVEVKRTDENCLAQLKGQVAAYQQHQGQNQAEVQPATTLSWAQVVRLATNVRNLRQLTGQASPYTADFVEFIQYHFPHWDEVLPFASIPFARAGGINEAAIYKRLHYVQQQAFGQRLKGFNDRVAMPIDVPWASEVITRPELHEQQGYIAVTVWPGNTKAQGWPLFARSLEWRHTKSLLVAEQEYAVNIECYLKFSHFNRYVFEVHVPSEFMTAEAFHAYAWQWKREEWPDLENQLTQALGPRWLAQKENWHRHFVNTDRSYAAVALGFAVSVYVPYAELRQLDRSTEYWQLVAEKFQQVIQALQLLVEGHPVPTEAH